MARVARLVLVLVAAAVLADVAGRVPEALAAVEHFRVEHVEIDGLRYLTRAEVKAALDLPWDASVWDDRARWEERLRKHPLVRSARIHRRFPATLLVELEERTPVGLLATPTLEPVDGRGHTLPLDPAHHRLDLPLLRVPAAGIESVGARSRNESPPRSGTTVEGAVGGSGSRPVRILAAEAARLGASEPAFVAGLSELVWERKSVLLARWGDPAVLLRFRAPLSSRRAREAMAVVRDARLRHPDRAIELVELRWADQVVVRFADQEGRVPQLLARPAEQGRP